MMLYKIMSFMYILHNIGNKFQSLIFSGSTYAWEERKNKGSD